MTKTSPGVDEEVICPDALVPNTSFVQALKYRSESGA